MLVFMIQDQQYICTVMPSSTRDNSLKSGTVPEILGQLEPMPGIKSSSWGPRVPQKIGGHSCSKNGDLQLQGVLFSPVWQLITSLFSRSFKCLWIYMTTSHLLSSLKLYYPCILYMLSSLLVCKLNN